MLIPLGTDRLSQRPVLIAPILLGLNILAFAFQQLLELRLGPDDAWRLTLPFFTDPHNFAWFQPITSGFLHAGVLHLLGNMLFLWVFAPPIEDRLGRWWFLLFYTAGLYAAALAHVAFDHVPAIGASGAIAALTGAFLVLFPRTQIKVFFILYLSPFWVSAWWLIGFAVLWDIVGQGLNADTGIAHMAHLGGSALGALTMLILLWLKLLPREVYDLFSMGRQALRRRQFKEAQLANQRRVEQHWKRRNSPAPPASPASPASTQSASTQSADQPIHIPAEALADARALIARLVDADDFPAAARAYRALVEAHAHTPAATTLPHRIHEHLALYLYTSADKQAAAYAIERYIDAYPKDSNTPRFRLLLGLLNANVLNDPIRAKALLTLALAELFDESDKALAQRELDALG